MPRDLQHLAAAAAAAGGAVNGWQLQSLTLNADWNYHEGLEGWFELSTALVHLTKAFPGLKHLDLTVPDLQSVVSAYDGTVAPVTAFDAAAAAAAAACLKARQQAAAPDAEIIHNNLSPSNSLDARYRAGQLRLISVAAAVAHAVMQLKVLQRLTIKQLPDIWRQTEGLTQLSEILQHVLSKAQRAKAAVAEDSQADAAADKTHCWDNEYTIAFAAALATLDDFGCWLLQQVSTLQEVSISLYTGRYMSWKQQQQQQQQEEGSTAAVPSAMGQADIIGIGTVWYPEEASELLQAKARHNGQEVEDFDLYGEFRLWLTPSAFTNQLSWYSSRSTSYLMSHITDCEFTVKGREVGYLADLLRDMKSLRHLEVCLEPELWSDEENFTGDIVSAAAAASGLQSLVVLSGWQINLPVDLLLPLTAAAGGPGSSLKKLKLLGLLVDAAATATMRASDPDQPRWHHVLRQLDGLCELVIISRGRILDLPVQSLPASLEVLETERLNIISAAPGDGVLHGQAASSVLASTDTGRAYWKAGDSYPRLRGLSLKQCQLNSPRIIASERLQQVTVEQINWSGGWAAAAAAWPNLRQLTWKYDPDFDITAGSNSSNANRHDDSMQRYVRVARNKDATEGPFIRQSFQEILVGLTHLRQLSVADLPPRAVGLLQPIVQQMKQLQHVHLDFCFKQYRSVVYGSDGMLGARAPEWHLLSAQLLSALLSKLAVKTSLFEAVAGHSSGVDKRNLYRDLKTIKSCLLQQLPWAGLSMSVCF